MTWIDAAIIAAGIGAAVLIWAVSRGCPRGPEA